MKNLYVIPTDKPSRLFYNVGGALLFTNYESHNGVNIYITSDEEIKTGDWYFITESISKCESTYEANDLTDICKKIILTTDQDLIKDGVQKIDDEFLEWFVKNPSCEYVEVEKGFLGMGGFCKSSEIISKDKIYYKIIIPKEEPKTFKELFANTGIKPTTDENGNIQYNFKATMKEEPKQETLEEAAERLAYDSTEENKGFPKIKAFKDGVKWQQERSYSEEDMRKAYSIGWITGERFDNLYPGIEVKPKRLDYEEEQDYAFNLWFEQLKNK